MRRIGPLSLDREKLVAWIGDEPLGLRVKEIELLLFLTDHSNEVCTKRELMDAVWKDSFVEESNLARHVYRLRVAFEELGMPRGLIETVPRRGYRFDASLLSSVEDAVLVTRRVVTTEIVDEVHENGAAENDTIKSGPRFPPGPRSLYLAVGVLAVLSIAGVLAFSGWFSKGGSAGDSVINSIAVLPVQTTNASEDEAAVAHGFAEVLVTELGKIRGLKVVSALDPSASVRLNEDPSSAGSELGTEAVLQCSASFVEGQMSVTVRLIRSDNGSQIWGDSFTSDQTSLFDIQNAIARKIAAALPGSEVSAQGIVGTSSETAYRSYLRGLYFLDRRTISNIRKARTEFEEAIGIDNRFAAAHAGLADALAMLGNRESGEKSAELYESARNSALRAIELDGSRSEGWASLGWIRRTHDWDWKGSEEAFRKAISIDPDNVSARQWYALLLTSLGRTDDALVQIEVARSLEPLSKSVLLNYIAVRHYRREFGLLPDLVAHLESLERDAPVNNNAITQAYLKAGEFSRVAEHHRLLEEKHPSALNAGYTRANIAIAYFKLGNLRMSEESLNFLERRAAGSPELSYRLALVYSEMGRKKEAIDLLERCFAARDDRMVWIKVEPSFDPLRNDPRFIRLVKEMGL